MRRRLVLVLGIAAAMAASMAWAQDGSAADEPLKDDWSGPGFYLNLLKLAATLLVFLAWVASTDWASRDAVKNKLPYTRWNSILFGAFMAALVASWLLPWFAAGFPLLLLAYAVPFASYVLQRNKKVAAPDKVFTRRHLKQWMATKFTKSGKIADEVDPHTAGSPVVLTARGAASQRDDNVNLLTARQTPGFTDSRHLIADVIYRRADAVTLDVTAEAVKIRHLIDGVWLDADPLDVELGTRVIDSLKALSGLNREDAQSRQQGVFLAQFEKAKYNASIVCQGTKDGGQRVLVQLESKQTQFDGLEDLGMRPKAQEQVMQLVNQPKGLLLFAAPPASGLRSTVNVVLRATDRFTREYMAFEEEKAGYERVENVPVTTYSAAQGQTALEILPQFFLQEPNVAVVRDLVDAEVVRMLCDEVEHGRVVISTVRAKDAVDAIIRVLAMKVPPKPIGKSLSGVVCQRLIRKLCEQCKQAFQPAPDVLKKLGIPEGRVEALYRPPEAAEGEKVPYCHVCNDVRYYGRTALFEVLLVDDAFRQALVTSPQPDLLRQAARKAGMRTFQEEGIALVAKGVTSIPELMRVLKQ